MFEFEDLFDFILCGMFSDAEAATNPKRQYEQDSEELELIQQEAEDNFEDPPVNIINNVYEGEEEETEDGSDEVNETGYDDPVEAAASEVVTEIVSVSGQSTAASVAAAVSSATTGSIVNENDPNPINKFCTCAAASCKCCRDFALPIGPLRGPGCATLKYLEDDKMLVTIKYGDFVLTSRTISGKLLTHLM